MKSTVNHKSVRHRLNTELKLKIRYFKRIGFSPIQAWNMATLLSGMKKLAVILAFGVLTSGCNNINRLLDPGEHTPPPDKPMLGGFEPISATVPEFNVPTPNGTVRQTYHGRLPSSNQITISNAQHSIRVFIKEGGQVNQWFQIPGFVPSSGYYYQFNQQTHVVTFYGLNIANKEFCIYEYVTL